MAPTKDVQSSTPGKTGEKCGENHPSEQSDDNFGSRKVHYKCCIKKECSVAVCVRCLAVFHTSCKGRLKGLKILDANKVLCCDADPTTTKHSSDRVSSSEFELMHRLLASTEEKNGLLIQNNQLLTEKIGFLEGELKKTARKHHNQIPHAADKDADAGDFVTEAHGCVQASRCQSERVNTCGVERMNCLDLAGDDVAATGVSLSASDVSQPVSVSLLVNGGSDMAGVTGSDGCSVVGDGIVDVNKRISGPMPSGTSSSCGSIAGARKTRNRGSANKVRTDLRTVGPRADRVASAPIGLEQMNLAVAQAQSGLRMGRPRGSTDRAGVSQGGPSSQGDAGETWQTVERKHRGRRFLVGNNSDSGAIRAVPRLASLHVTRLSPGTSVDDLMGLLVAEFPEVNCVELQSRHPLVYKSFKVTVRQDSVRRAWKRELWPDGALVSRFMDGRRPHLDSKS